MTRSVVPFPCSFTTVPITTGALPFRNIPGDLKCSSVTLWFRPSIRTQPRGSMPCAGQVVHAGDRCQHTGREPVLSHDCGFYQFPLELIIGNTMAGLAAARLAVGKVAGLGQLTTRKSVLPKHCSETRRTVLPSMTASDSSKSQEPFSIATSRKREFEDSCHCTTELSAIPVKLTRILSIGGIPGDFRCSRPQSAAFAWESPVNGLRELQPGTSESKRIRSPFMGTKQLRDL